MKTNYLLISFLILISLIQVKKGLAMNSQTTSYGNIEKKPMRFYIEKLDGIIDQHIKLFKKYTSAEVFGRGGGCPDKITSTTLTFLVKSTIPVDIKKARQLAIKGSQDLLYRINQDKSLESGLKNYPYNTSNIEYGYYFADETGEIYLNKEGEVNPNCLTTCKVINNCIYYMVKYAPLTGEKVHQETYEEALEIVRKERPDLLEPLKEGDRFED